MARIDLKVPFAEKEEAKSLGAKWDPSLKTWYIPEGVDIGPLAQWLPVTEHADLEHGPEFCVRAPYYYVMDVGVRLLGLLQFDSRVLIQAARATRRIRILRG
ncbi:MULTISPECIES: DUF5710 domain-containing protein [unclassified Pseudomonas]|uniref:DUF5710 domain-containing protein n=1 Tax=unclassified Pseudomonas TaxID=196821 RepID=UPI0021145B69|nr:MULTISPECIES: DUF5710 domain-containing protein [unclassified Pseudomonas]